MGLEIFFLSVKSEVIQEHVGEFVFSLGIGKGLLIMTQNPNSIMKEIDKGYYTKKSFCRKKKNPKQGKISRHTS